MRRRKVLNALSGLTLVLGLALFGLGACADAQEKSDSANCSDPQQD